MKLGQRSVKNKEAMIRAKFRKSRLFWYHIISPPGVSIDCASLGKKKVGVPQTKKVRREKKKVVREFLLSSRVKTPRAASMKKKRSKGNPSKQETLACRCGLRCWRERWAGAGLHALTLRPRHRRPVRCVSLVVMSDGQ